MVAHLSQLGWSAIGRAVSRAAKPCGCPKWLVWLLCILAWRGPIPVVHSHELEHAQTIEVARHLARYHDPMHSQSPATHDQAEAHSTSWHVHFILPDGDSAPGSESDSDTSKTLAWPGLLPELMAAASGDQVSGPWIQFNAADWCRQLSLENHVGSQVPISDVLNIAWLQSTEKRCASMFDRTPSLSPHALLCVARC